MTVSTLPVSQGNEGHDKIIPLDLFRPTRPKEFFPKTAVITCQFLGAPCVVSSTSLLSLQRNHNSVVLRNKALNDCEVVSTVLVGHCLVCNLVEVPTPSFLYEFAKLSEARVLLVFSADLLNVTLCCNVDREDSNVNSLLSRLKPVELNLVYLGTSYLDGVTGLKMRVRVFAIVLDYSKTFGLQTVKHLT